MDKKTKILTLCRQHRRWLWPLFLVLLALTVRLAAPGYTALWLALLGVAGLLCLYYWLFDLGKCHPKITKALTWTVNIGLVLGLTAVIITGGLIFRAANPEPATSCDYVIVLGAKVDGSEPSGALSERIAVAYDYLMAHPDAIAVVSGGKGNDENISEAQCMYNELTRMGIDPARIWMEDRATSTLENLQFSLALIREKTGTSPETVAIASSEFHLFRAGRVAQKCGVEAVGIPAKTGEFHRLVNYTLREIAVVWYYFLLGGL